MKSPNDLLVSWLGKQVWKDRPDAGAIKWALIYVARLGWCVASGYERHRLGVHAQALTYVSLLSILPFIAVLFALIEASDMIQTSMVQAMFTRSLPEFRPLFDHIFPYLEATDFRSLGYAGILFLLLTVRSLMHKIEFAFNEIWNVYAPRPFWRQILEYSLILIAIALLVVSPMILQLVSTDLASQLVPELEPFAKSKSFTDLISFISMGFGFTLLNHSIPNTKVGYKPALISGFLCGVMYSGVSWAYFGLQVGMANYNLIYSSVAILFITAIWLQVSWAIVLICAELTCCLSQEPAKSRPKRASLNPKEA